MDDTAKQSVWSRTEQIIERFEQAWQQGQRPNVDDYLALDGADPHALLIELVHADLECRLKAGESTRVEDYFSRYPELTKDRPAFVGLITAEYKHRGRREPDRRLQHG